MFKSIAQMLIWLAVLGLQPGAFAGTRSALRFSKSSNAHCRAEATRQV
jgi:hypothetical protein